MYEVVKIIYEYSNKKKECHLLLTASWERRTEFFTFFHTTNSELWCLQTVHYSACAEGSQVVEQGKWKKVSEFLSLSLSLSVC